MKKSKHLLAIILSIALVVSCFAGMSVSTVNAVGNSKYSTEEVILHCWNWPISKIKAQLNDIKEAGYTAIQTSPINGIVGSGSSSADNTVSNWYQFYQPKNYTIGNKICTQAEFESFCSEAHELGLKVIVDVVLNHTTDQTSQVSGIEKDYHGNGEISNWDDRWQQTQKNITGMPDLNTNNTNLQSQANTLLRNIISAGADGFRFDAAKHIELPSGDEISGCPTSNYWPTVLSGVTDKFSYGEVLAGQNCPLTGYSKYMNVTGSAYSDTVQGCARNENFPVNNLTDYNAGLGGNNLVCWAESHDNYKGGNYGMPNSQIKLAWAAITAQNLNTLYLARPYGSTTSSWQGSNKTTDGGDDFYFDKEVVAVNKFHNAAKGKGVSLENVSGNTQVLAVKRENVGVCIINASSGSKSISVGTSMPNGTYKDAANGGTFYVNNGTLTGTVGAKSVAAVFKEGSTSPTSSTSATNAPAGKYTVTFTNNQNWGSVYLYAWNSSGSNAAWPGVQLSQTGTNEYNQGQFTANIDDAYTNIIFNNGNNGEQTVDITNTTRNGSVTGYYPNEKNSQGKWTVGTWEVQGASTAAPTQAPTTIAPTTAAPTTQEPTEAPTTAAPTVAPTTAAPTVAPTTQEPTEAPTTLAPTTAPPTTAVPTTVAPTTAAPTTVAPTTAAPTVATNNTVKFTNNKGWSKVYLYAWGDNGSNATWPGVELTEKSTNTYNEEQYTATFDKKYTKIIFNNGNNGEQTVDITYDNTVTGYYPNEKNNEGKWTVGSWTDEVVTTAAPTQAPTTVAPTTAEPTSVEPEKTEYTIRLNTNGLPAFSGGNIYCNVFNGAMDVLDGTEESFVMTALGNNMYSVTFKSANKLMAFTCPTGGGLSQTLVPASKDYSIMNETMPDAAGNTTYKVVEGIQTLPTDPESTTTTPEQPTTAPYNPSVYVDSNGQSINLNETVQRDAADTALTGIGSEFKNLQILGVQKRKDTSKRNIRFVTVANSDILKDAADYGYIAIGASSVNSARTVIDGYTLDNAPAKHVFSCKGSSNKISGDYGKSDSNTKYKYVTYAVNNIADYAIAVKFYVKDKSGNVYYATYTNANSETFSNCAVNWAALS